MAVGRGAGGPEGTTYEGMAGLADVPPPHEVSPPLAVSLATCLPGCSLPPAVSGRHWPCNSFVRSLGAGELLQLSLMATNCSRRGRKSGLHRRAHIHVHVRVSCFTGTWEVPTVAPRPAW